VLFEGACAHFRTGSFAAGVALVDAIAGLADAANHHPDVDPHGRGPSFWFQEMDSPRPSAIASTSTFPPARPGESPVAAAITPPDTWVTDHRAGVVDAGRRRGQEADVAI
jgi:hypothetical protein